MSRLADIFAEINASGGTTDKNTLHSYVPLYEELFAPYANKKNGVILEIGVRDGSSLRAWSRYFNEWQVVGIDNFSELGKKPDVSDIPRCELFKVDTTDLMFPGSIIEVVYDFPDVIIDDGLHHPYSQVANLAIYSKFLRNDGIYIIEDIEDISFANKMAELFGGHVYDLRHVKQRHDDIVLVWRKKK